MEDGKRDGNTNWWSNVLLLRLCFSFVTWAEPPREDAVGEKSERLEKKKLEEKQEAEEEGEARWSCKNGLNKLSD